MSTAKKESQTQCTHCNHLIREDDRVVRINDCSKYCYGVNYGIPNGVTLPEGLVIHDFCSPLCAMEHLEEHPETAVEIQYPNKKYVVAYVWYFQRVLEGEDYDWGTPTMAMRFESVHELLRLLRPATNRIKEVGVEEWKKEVASAMEEFCERDFENPENWAVFRDTLAIFDTLPSNAW